MRFVQAQDFDEMFAQIVDKVSGAAHPKLAEVTQILSNLRRIKIELLSQFLRRDGLDSGSIQLVEATQVNAESVRGELRDFFSLHNTAALRSITPIAVSRKVKGL